MYEIFNSLKSIKKYKECIKKSKERIKLIIGHFIFINYTIIINLVFIILSKESKEEKYSYITLKINSKGKKQFFNARKIGYFINYNFPDIVQINGLNYSNEMYEYDFESKGNIVKLIWNSPPNSTKLLFFECYDLSDIDLSNFDTSEITDMEMTFYECSSLISLN